MEKRDIFLIIVFLVVIIEIYFSIKIMFKTDTCKTITGYETRNCTIYSDGTEDCEIERG